MDKVAIRKALIEQRLNIPDRLARADLLQRVMRIWLVGRPDLVIGAYWPIKGEFDPLPALHRWKEDGELIDEPALLAALKSGHNAAAGLDVFAAEPAGADNPLFALPQVVVSPHIAWLTPETLDRSIAVARENCRRIHAGEPLLHRVV